MSRFFALRLLEAFFSRWLLCLLPVLLLGALGVSSVVGQDKEYRSEGVLYVERETLLTNLTDFAGIGSGGGTSSNTPAQTTAERVSSLLETDDFMRTVVEGASLTSAVDAGATSLVDVRSSIGIVPGGANTVRISSTDPDAGVAYRLARATIDGFIEWVVDASLRESAAAEAFLQELAVTNKADLDAARKALNAYIVQHPDPATGLRPLAETIQISRLDADVTTASTRYSETLAKAADARLAAAKTRSDVAGRLRLVDPPEVPAESTSTRMQQVLQLAMFLMLGLLLSGGAVFAGALADRSIRQPSDVPDRLGVPLLAMLPDGGRPLMRGMRMATLVSVPGAGPRRARSRIRG